MNSTDKLFLLDAYALIYRAYYAFIKNPRINSKGFNTSAILGFVNTLEEVLKKENPTHIGVAFDPSGPTFRHKAYEQYKAQREETPEAIRLSVPIIKDIIRAYRIPILEVPGYEADDVIGTLATEAGRQGIVTYMMTPDKDYGQLVSENVFMYRPKHSGGFEVMGIEEIKAKFDIQSTEQVIDMLGLMGDSSDNIPGCPGVGEKTAQKLVAEFGSIENLLAHTDRLKGALKTKVEANREMIAFSKFLATIKVDVPIKLDMNTLVREEPNEEELRKIFEELEFRTLIDRVLKKTGSPLPSSSSSASPDPYAGTLFAQPTDGTTSGNNAPVQGDLFANFADNGTGDAKNSILTRLEMLDVDYQLIDTEEKRKKIIQKLLTKEILSIDTETTGTEPMEAELVGMSFSDAENRAYYVPVPANRDEALKIVNEFRPLYENENSMKVGQNIKYDDCPSKLRSTGKRKTFRHHACPLCIATGAPAQHGLPCRNLSALPDHPHRRTYRSQRQEPKEHARSSAGRRIPLRLRRCGRYTETEERTRKRTERARCRTSLLRNRDAARTGARQHRKQRSAYRYGSA